MSKSFLDDLKSNMDKTFKDEFLDAETNPLSADISGFYDTGSYMLKCSIVC